MPLLRVQRVLEAAALRPAIEPDMTVEWLKYGELHLVRGPEGGVLGFVSHDDFDITVTTKGYVVTPHEEAPNGDV